MNINTSGNSIQKRIQALQESSSPSQLEKKPVETGLSKTDFEQRKALFEKGMHAPTTEKALETESQIQSKIQTAPSENLSQTAQELNELGLNFHEISSREQESEDNDSIPDLSQIKRGYETPQLKPNQVMIDGHLYETVSNNENYKTYTTQLSNDSNDSDDFDEYDEIEVKDYTQPEVKNTSEAKYSETSSNHHKVEYRVKSNVDGIRKGYEFDLGNSKYTAMFESDEAQNENKLHFSEKGVTRGSDQELLTTQTPTTGLWAGSKANRMLFVMEPNGQIHAIDPNKPISHKGATVLDVRIHHSSLLNGQEVAGAGEIQVSSGLTPEEFNHLQTVVLKRVQKQFEHEQDLKPEVMQKMIAQMVDLELGKILKNHQPGQIEVISDRSGHYRPNLEMTAQTLEELQEKGVDISRVNVELGDKIGGSSVLEGELMVPSSTVISSKEVPNGEVQLRAQHARKMNVQQELLSKFGQKSENYEKQKNNLNQLLGKYLSESKFEKAAIIYERLMFLHGVGTSGKVSENQREYQEKQILKHLQANPKIPTEKHPLLIMAYENLIEDRKPVVKTEYRLTEGYTTNDTKPNYNTKYTDEYPEIEDDINEIELNDDEIEINYFY